MSRKKDWNSTTNYVAKYNLNKNVAAVFFFVLFYERAFCSQRKKAVSKYKNSHVSIKSRSKLLLKGFLLIMIHYSMSDDWS